MRAAAGQFFLLNPHGRQSTLMSNDCSPTIWRPTIWGPTGTYTTSVALAAWVCAFLGHIQSGNVYSVLHHPVQGAEGDANPTFTIFNFKVPVNDIRSLHSWGWQGFQVLQGHAGAWNPVPKNVEKLRLTSGAAVCDLTLLWVVPLHKGLALKIVVLSYRGRTTATCKHEV